MMFRKILVAIISIIVFLNSGGDEVFLDFGAKAIEAIPGYIPIEWALIVLGGFDYYRYPPGNNAIQKTEHWIQSEGVPYDIIEDDEIEAPTDTPASGKYPLQYANGTTRYGVFVIIMNQHADTSAVNINHIYWAVGNGTNAVIFGTAAIYVPALLDISPDNASYFTDYGVNQINCTIHKTFSDGIIEYRQGTNQTINNPYFLHANVSRTQGKTIWYTMHSDTGKNWIGMMNTTYGLGKVFWSTVIPNYNLFFRYNTFSVYWETNNLKFVAHAIHFLYRQVKRVDLGLQGYKKWRGAITYRLDQDDPWGIAKPPEEALKAGWYVDVVICPLGYKTTGANLTQGMPDGYIASPSTRIKHGTWTYLVASTNPPRFAFRTFVLYNSTIDGNYDTVKVDWNQNNDFSDDEAFKIWQNMTSDITGLTGTYYWSYIDNWTEPSVCRLGWWCPLRDRISDFSWWKTQGQKGYIRYGLHSFQHQSNGDATITSGYVTWNGTQFLLNQTWIEQKFTEARQELAYCLGSTGYGFEADKVLVSHGGNEFRPEVDNTLHNLSWVYLTYGDNAKNEPSWFLFNDRKNAMTCGGSVGRPHIPWSFEALEDAVKTLFPIFGIYEHDQGIYNLTYNVYPPSTAYTDMFCFAHLDESFEFWNNARYMWINTLNAYYRNNQIILEYKANSTLKDYVWKFPIEHNGKSFTGFSDNRTTGKIKHIDGKYVYIEFSEGGNERIEVTYGTNPHIYQTSRYIENISQIYNPKNLTLQLWNSSGTIEIRINCTRLGQPNSVKIDETLINFNYNTTTKLCSFNITLSTPVTVNVLWEYAPPNPPIILAPARFSRFDQAKPITLAWQFNDPDSGDIQSAYCFQLSDNYFFYSAIIDTGKVMSASTQITYTLPETIGRYFWRVKTWDNQNNESEWSDAQPLIVDKLEIVSKGATKSRTNIEDSVSIFFQVKRCFDNTFFEGPEGAVYINGSQATWDITNKRWELSVTQTSVGEWKYEVSNVVDTRFNLSKINDLVGEQHVIWDKVIVTITSEKTTATVGDQVYFQVTAVYAYDNKKSKEYTVEILKDGSHYATNNFIDVCSYETTHQYTTESVIEKVYGLTAFDSNILTVTWVSKSFTDWLTTNILIVIPVIGTVVVVIYVLLRRRER